MDFARGSDHVRNAGVLILSLGVVVGLWVVSDGSRLIAGLVEGRWFPEAARYLAIHRSLDPDVRTTSFYVEHGSPVLLRLALAWIVIGAVLASAGGWIARSLRALFAETSTAQDLALVRITVFGAMFWWWLHNDLTAFAALPPELIVPPPGLSWTVPFLPTDPTSARVLSIAFGVATLLAAIGLWTRPSAWAATALGILALGIPQFCGKIDHYHHFVWFGALIAAAPSGDAWSADASRRGERNPSDRARAYAFPARVIMLLIGSFYFFAGFWKVVIGGPAWPGETMRTILHAQWMRIDTVPPLRVDTWGAWTTIGGSAVVVFEILFVALILTRSTRVWAAIAGVVFHVAVYVTTGINFWTLLVCYTVFLDTSWFRRAVPGETVPRIPPEPSGGLRRLGASLITTSIVCGVLLVDSWPIAVYPTFAGIPEPRAWTLTLEGTTADGRTVQVRPWRSEPLRSKYGNSRVGGLVSQVAWAQDPERRAAKAVAFAGVAAAIEPMLTEVMELSVYRELVDVDPARWNEPPVRRERLGVWRRVGG